MNKSQRINTKLATFSRTKEANVDNGVLIKQQKSSNEALQATGNRQQRKGEEKIGNGEERTGNRERGREKKRTANRDQGRRNREWEIGNGK